MEPSPEHLPSGPSDTNVPSTSVVSRFFNVVATPGDVFDEVIAAPPCNANWLLPALIAVVVGWLATAWIFSQAPIQNQLRELTEQAIEKQIAMTKPSAQQAEQMRAAAEKMAGVSQKISAYIAVPFAVFISPFLWGLFLWLVGKYALRGQFSYMKAVEVVGLSNVIGILESVIRTLLIVSMGSLFASTSLALLVKDYNPQNPAHNAMALVNIMTFWCLAVRAMGLARLARSSFSKAAVWVFGIWIAYTGFFFAVGVAFQAVMKKVTG